MSIAWRYPGPVQRWLFRTPIGLYRIGLGRLMGGWPVGQAGVRMGIMLLITTGRKSRLRRVTAIEYREWQERFYLVSAWGHKADWLRNIEHHPEVEVRAGTQRARCRGRVLETPEEKDEAFRVWVLANPNAAARFFRFLGLEVGKTEAEQRQTLDRLTLVRLDPLGT